MARAQLLNLPMQRFHQSRSIPIVFLFAAIISVFSVFSIISFLCASHRKTKKQDMEKDEEQTSSMSSKKKSFSKLNSEIGSKAHSILKMVSWKKIQVDQGKEEKEDDDGIYCCDSDEAVWRREIMMGERCRPLDFSGKIEYDSEGNLIPNSSMSPSQSNTEVSPKKC